MEQNVRFKPYIHKVMYYETDKMGVTHHSNYIRFLEESRIDFLEQVGYTYQRMEKEGVISPVVSVRADFKKPTTFADEIEIKVNMKSYTGVKFVFEYIMTNKATNEIVVTGETEHCFTTPEGRPIIIKKQFPEMHDFFTRLIEK